MKCRICEQGCTIPEGSTGICRMYTVRGGEFVERHPDAYLTVMPVSIETVPVLHYSPRAKVLQVSTVGCTFSCPGCISEVLIGDPDGIAGALRHRSPAGMVERAEAEGCSGIVFCLNEPAASFPTFLRLARAAQEAGLSVGCSTNGYFTEEALNALIPHLDYMNVGLKGVSDGRYRACGAAHAAPVFRNIGLCAAAGVHVEASVMYLRGGEEEVLGAARRLVGISPEIPLQVMRFVPFGDACAGDEPTVLESEDLCRRAREILPFVYLFNSPGTPCLDTLCPRCGERIIGREFYGPMGARTVWARSSPVCSCGERLPVRGAIGTECFDEPGLLGGYRTTRAFEMVRAILACLGAGDGAALQGFWSGIVNENFIGGMHDRIQTIDGYLGLVDDIGARAGRQEEAAALHAWLSDRTEQVMVAVAGSDRRPRLYYSMGTPLFALNAGRFEVCLAGTAGATVVNRQIPRKGKPGVNISSEEFLALNPEVIIVSGFLSAPAEDYLRFCHEGGLIVDAVRTGAVYTMPPGWDFGSPRWVLGLMALAATLHPDHCAFDLDEEERAFYRRFYGVDPEAVNHNRSFRGTTVK
ncbi:radical SAM protein [Methanofollis fontis]|uniref:Radical SAM protein n=1 Tax=Methanofollis fontis TaxID=2052832 RepID=A0A483CQF6_9EURY|nr:radical SAM protein [Methanofollis fontis]TAJ45355.1 radical SAM protein [Methanofollis fontis]